MQKGRPEKYSGRPSSLREQFFGPAATVLFPLS